MSRATRSRCKKLVADSSDDIVRERRVSPHNIPYTMTDPPNAFNRGDSPNRRVLPSAPTNYPVDCPAGSPCNPPTADQPGIQDQVVNGNEMSQVLHILEMLRAENKTTSSELSGLRQENAETRKDLVEIKQQLSRTTDSIEQFTIECNRRIEGLESDIGTNKQSIKRNEEATGINKREISQLGENMVLLEEKVERQQTVIDEQKRMLKEVLNELQGIQKEKRRKCFVIENLKEMKEEKVRDVVQELLVDIGVEQFTANQAEAIFRLGKQSDKSSRPIMVKCANFDHKKAVFEKAAALKGNEKYPRVRLSDDLTKQQIREKKDLGCIHALARSRNIKSKLRSTCIIIEGRKYDHRDLGALPYDLSMENAKIVDVRDGVAFQGPHAFYSNLYLAKVKDEQHKEYESVEHWLTEKCANEHKDDNALTKLGQLKNQDPFEYKFILDSINKSNNWKKHELTTLEEMVRAKFEQNPCLAKRLCERKDHIYEATAHPVYGIGYTLADARKIHQGAVNAGNNHMGKILARVRAGLTGSI